MKHVSSVEVKLTEGYLTRSTISLLTVVDLN